MSKMMFALFAGGLSLAGAVVAQVYVPKSDTIPASRDDDAMAGTKAGIQFGVDQDACQLLDGSAGDVCDAQAKSKEGAASQDARSLYEGTPGAREHSSLWRAQASYNLAVEDCADLAGDSRDVCVLEVRDRFAEELTRATDERAADDARLDAAASPPAVRNQGYVNMRAAEYAVVIEECDPHPGSARNACISNADVKYGSNAEMKYGKP